MGWSRMQSHKTTEGTTMHTNRCTSPLKPIYQLASPSVNNRTPATEPLHTTYAYRHRSPTHSRVINTSDIPGATAKSNYRTRDSGPYNVDHMNMRDVTSPERRRQEPRQLMTVSDIEGASPKRFGSRSTVSSSPGRGTLYNADIEGATSPSRSKGHPSNYSHEFSGQPRVMMSRVVPPWGEV